ncbi:hypothetical protein [Butyrivibrio sp. MB2005]|uniref:hypothetical protein n=1 Tax=Butyrivibrio sp. MB2005 TaxID=1280678 RepID=UPI0003FBE62F|nr:hypothetical protein [Butyrivibrio sp. MB2005]
MPAYFSIDISIRKKDIYEGIYADFIGLLQEEGLRFAGGYMEFMDETLEEIISWNEEKLLEDFSIGVDEHYSHDFRQVCFDYHGLSEVRMFILNVTEDDEFNFIIIVPEDELIQLKDGKFSYKPAIMEDLKQLIVKIWDFESVAAIQTTLELSGETTSVNDLEKGARPMIVPFAVIPKGWMNDDLGEGISVTPIAGDGVLLEDIQ